MAQSPPNPRRTSMNTGRCEKKIPIEIEGHMKLNSNVPFAICVAGVLAAQALAQQGGGGRTGLFGDLTMVRDAVSRRVASNSPDPGSNGDNRYIKAGET